MTNSKILFDNLVNDLAQLDSIDEIQAIAFEVLSHFGILRTEVLSQKMTALEYQTLIPIINRLKQHEPIQYILNEAWFCGHKFYVNPSVLIPRPETESIVEEAMNHFSEKEKLSILDIGTGSGCIAVSLAFIFPKAEVTAIDISEDALQIARKNAKQFDVDVNFLNHDILKNPIAKQNFDLIVSNPPYIATEEKPNLAVRVTAYEPHVALFAGTDPLIFYRAIAQLASQTLNPGGLVIVEINERFPMEVCEIFRGNGLEKISSINDLSGKPRLVKGYLK